MTLGYRPVSLGNSRMHTETAILVTCVEVALWHRLSFG